MAQGDVLLNSDGTIALDATGKVRLVDASSDCPDCCDSCTASGTACTHCDDTTPSQYQATFYGITLCGCEVGGTDYSFEYAANGGWDINDTFTLTQKAGSSCVWELLLSDQMTLNAYFSSEVCGGAADETTLCDVRIVLTRAATTWTLGVFAEPDGGVAVGLFEQFVGVNADTAAGSQLCATITNAFTNVHTTCVEITDETGHATGGTATVVCV